MCSARNMQIADGFRTARTDAATASGRQESTLNQHEENRYGQWTISSLAAASAVVGFGGGVASILGRGIFCLQAMEA